MKTFRTIVVLFIVAGFASNAYAGASGIWEYSFIHHRVHENGEQFNRLYFAITDESGNPAEYDLGSVKLYDPDGTELTISDLKFSSDSTLQGEYDADKGQWFYDDTFTTDPGYYANFQALLVDGSYLLNVVVDGQNFNKYIYYSGIRELPIISSNSFQKKYDDNGNLHLKWKAPLYTESDNFTSTRAYIDIYKDSTNTNHFLYVTAPTHLDCLFVPKNIIDVINGIGNTFRFYIHIRINDNSNRAYSNKVAIDQIPGFSDCDVNYDGRTGLEEAIHALKITAGIENL